MLRSLSRQLCTYGILAGALVLGGAVGDALAQGRLSPASLDLDTCGCPTTFGDPTCSKETSWTLDKTTNSGPFSTLDQTQPKMYTFNVSVVEGPTSTVLRGMANWSSPTRASRWLHPTLYGRGSA